MGLYGDAAIRATKYLLQRKINSPREAWHSAIAELSASPSSRRKSCPKNAFLGLCEAGVISGIAPRTDGDPSINKNGQYALKAYTILQSEPGLSGDKARLWARVMSEPKKENEQMDVVTALWNKNLLR